MYCRHSIYIGLGCELFSCCLTDFCSPSDYLAWGRPMINDMPETITEFAYFCYATLIDLEAMFLQPFQVTNFWNLFVPLVHVLLSNVNVIISGQRHWNRQAGQLPVSPAVLLFSNDSSFFLHCQEQSHCILALCNTGHACRHAIDLWHGTVSLVSFSWSQSAWHAYWLSTTDLWRCQWLHEVWLRIYFVFQKKEGNVGGIKNKFKKDALNALQTWGNNIHFENVLSSQ